MTRLQRFLAWLGDVALGPRCPVCDWRARGWRTLADHLETSQYRCGEIHARRTEARANHDRRSPR